MAETPQNVDIEPLTDAEWNAICRAAGEHSDDACDALKVAVERIIAERERVAAEIAWDEGVAHCEEIAGVGYNQPGASYEGGDSNPYRAAPAPPQPDPRRPTVADDRCLNCNQTLRVINYVLGERLMHVDRDASFPSAQKGTAWRHCRQRVATLPPTPIDGLTDPCPTPEYEPERRISPDTNEEADRG